MIETKFIKDVVREYQIGEFISNNLQNVGFAGVKVHKTPLGEKIVITASRPGLVVGRKGENIQNLTRNLKEEFGLENPQIEIVEVKKPNLDATIVAERISSSLERFGLARFKGIGHRVLTDVMGSGAKGVEILISGKIPSSRAKRWRFYQGYLKKSGDIAVSGIRKAYTQAKLKTGVVGIQVRIMPPDLTLPDTITPRDLTIGELMEQKEAAKKDASEKEATDAKPAKKTAAKTTKKAAKKTTKKAAAKKTEEKPAADSKEEVVEKKAPSSEAAAKETTETKE